MIDENFKVWLIEINTNPCLESAQSPILTRIIPALIDNALRIAVDPLFPPPFTTWKNSKRYMIPDNIFLSNKFELIFDEKIDEQELNNLFKKNDKYED